MGVLLAVTGCASSGGAGMVTKAPSADPPPPETAAVAVDGTEATSESVESSDRAVSKDGAWIGAAAESSVLLAGTTDTAVGVWVDAPSRRDGGHVPVDVALVVDTSGSMSGAKIESARQAAKTLIAGLADGDIVTVDAFSDHARSIVAPTAITPATREALLGRIDALRADGGTNMFEGLSLAEQHAAQAPASHPVRRVVMLSDGLATVGITSPQMLGDLAERGLRQARVQVTSLGVGVDYDERTLDALAVRTSGRLYHLGDVREMQKTIEDELALLGDTVASDAFVEVVPAPGVRLAGADGVSFNWAEAGSMRIPLGALHAGQHREALVRVRVDPSSFGRSADARPLASVRLRFHDSADGDVERVQEVVARAGVTSDASEVAMKTNARTQAIATIQKAAKMELAASDAANHGDFGAAQAQLAQAESTIRAQAATVKDEGQKKRLAQAAGGLSAARASAGAAAAAPKAVQRDVVLRMNSAAMDSLGY
jgi:Ca-activated chloride channel family protein